MTPQEPAIVEIKLKEVAEILYKNTPDEELNSFETIELSLFQSDNHVNHILNIIY